MRCDGQVLWEEEDCVFAQQRQFGVVDANLWTIAVKTQRQGGFEVLVLP